jgi:hypothetical protein
MTFARWMDPFRGVRVVGLTATLLLAPAAGFAAEGSSPGVQFQKPSRPSSRAASPGGAQFARPASSTETATAPAVAPPSAPAAPATAEVSGNPLRGASAARVVGQTAAPAQPTFAQPTVQQAAFVDQPARPIAEAPRVAPTRSVTRKAPLPAFAQPETDLLDHDAPARRSRNIAAASIQPWVEQPTLGPDVQQASFCTCGEPTCGICEPACGLAEPGCGIVEPGCGIEEPGCGIVEPGCGILEPTCGCGEPDCGIPGCGSCVANSGPDFWCFPVCLPRLKDLRVWAGVHGFKGPRDSPDFGGAGDGNFGFQEGFNLGGRAPLVSRLFPQLSYQLGYQAVQSHLSGTSDGGDSDRAQQFVTAGLFRRVNAGIQFGVAWDLLRDDFQAEEDWNQLRYEVSMKSAAGREFGFTGASSLSDATVGGITYETVDQYLGFIRCHFREGGNIRFFGGATNDSEGLFGGDFLAPLNNRWAIQSGFNYLITDLEEGADAAREESWNVGINLVWFYGYTAKQSNTNPHAPLFPVADNGWMFIDQVR